MAAKKPKKKAVAKKSVKKVAVQTMPVLKAKAIEKPAENPRLKRKIIISACVAVGLFIFASIFLNLITNVACVDKCGDFTCDEIVCMSEGCPCSENYRTCPSDCHEARFEDLAEFAKDSECIEKGELTENYAFNPETRTWWINMKMKPEFEKDGCSPACVIYEDEDKVELNWGCTGLAAPE